MLGINKYKEIYRILDTSPAEFDCGTLCGSACCSNASFDPEESYIYLLPGEKGYLDSEGCNMRIVKDKCSDHYLPGSWGEYVYIARCPGKDNCRRDMRPIQCRTFPLQPYISDDGTLKMILSPAALPYSCPFTEGEAAISEEFHRAAYEAWSILITDEAIRELVMLDSDNGNTVESITDNEGVQRFRCPCCGYYTLPDRGEYDICPVCFWEDDPVQEEDPDMEGGANKLSLNECKKNFKIYGACEERFKDKVRDPLPEECLSESGEDI